MKPSKRETFVAVLKSQACLAIIMGYFVLQVLDIFINKFADNLPTKEQVGVLIEMNKACLEDRRTAMKGSAHAR